MTTEINSLFELKNLHFIYPTHWGLRNLNVTFKKNSVTALLGPNGAGKSTLIKLLAGMRNDYSGNIRFKGKEIKSFSRKELATGIGYVPQEIDIQYDYTVGDLLQMGRYPYQRVWDRINDTDRKIIKKCMEITEIEEFENRPFVELSGGEKKRVLIASALVQEPDVLLLDEPTNGLDLRHQMELFKVLKGIFKSQLSGVVLITHDLNFAAKVCDYFIMMVNGQIVSEGNINLMTDANLLQKVFNVNFSIVHSNQNETIILTRYE